MIPSASDPVAILSALIQCRSITPKQAGTLDLIQSLIEPMGFSVERPVFGEKGTQDVENLYARRGARGAHLSFAGHVDVVPPGDESAWSHPPFEGKVADGHLYGRGAVDMKGAIACFIAAVARSVEAGTAPKGSISLMITSDEEGPSINGTIKLLQWASERGERWDAAIVGEPSGAERVGDSIKHGRRGSLSGRITARGIQGHSAYPHRADNAVHSLLSMLSSLRAEPFDEGNERFEASNLQIVSVDAGNEAANVIPAEASALFNLRFNDQWTGDSAKREIQRRLAAGAERAKRTESARQAGRRREAEATKSAERCGARFEVEWIGLVSEPFATKDDGLIETLRQSIREVCNLEARLSTGGGTSDARFIHRHCPVAELGLVGKTMHAVDERVPLEDLETLARIYRDFIERWFAAQN